jgi:hypothetical protein
MKRLLWTLSAALAGVFLAVRSAPVHPKWVFLAAILGGVIGLGFGSIFTSKNARLVIVYWALTFAVIGSVFGLEEPVCADRLLRLSVYGAIIAIALGLLNHLVQSHKNDSQRLAPQDPNPRT